MVDGRGRGAWGTIAELESPEGGPRAPLRPPATKPGLFGAASSSGLGELPSPEAIIARAQALSRTGSRGNDPPSLFQSNPTGESDRDGGSPRSMGGILNFPTRCRFLPGGHHFVHSQPPRLSTYQEEDWLSYGQTRHSNAASTTGLALRFSSVLSHRPLYQASWSPDRYDSAEITVVALMAFQDTLLVEMSSGETLWMPVLQP
ncbi:unnamed protein product, partial [Phytomonas sp. EM1]